MDVFPLPKWPLATPATHGILEEAKYTSSIVPRYWSYCYIEANFSQGNKNLQIIVSYQFNSLNILINKYSL